MLLLYFALAIASAAQQPPQSENRPPTPPRPNDRTDATDYDSAGHWLVHLARHHGHVVGRGDPRAATLHALALMMAASKVDPNLPTAWLWQYDLYGRIDRPQEALDALRHYVDLQPDNETAALLLTDESIGKLQNADARVNYIKQQLALPNLARSVASNLNLRLAEYHRERGDNENAGKCIENALRLMPTNVAARQLSYELFGETEPALQRVELGLAMVAANPGQVNLLWQLGELLDSLSLHREAQEWYVRAVELHERADKTPIPGEDWYTLAQSYAASADYKLAAEAIDKAIAADPNLGRAQIFKAYLNAKLKAADPDAPINALAKKYDAEAEQVLASRNIAKAAELAWFYAYYRPDPVKALKLAQLATSIPDSSSLARRALGFAYLINNKNAEALDTLKPLSDADQLAAVGAARALLALQKEPDAAALLRKAATLNYSGIGFDEIAKMLEKSGDKPPARPGHDRIVEALHRFDRRIFDFHKKPGDFLKLTLLPIDAPEPPVGPWNTRVRLENVGPFPITVGEGLMAQPLTLFTAQLGDDKAARFENYTQLLLMKKPVLAPGDVIEFVTALDVGQLREQMLHSPSWSTPVEITALFDPVATATGFDKGLSTVEATPLRFDRAGLPRDLPGVKRLVLALNDAPLKERLRAIDALGALLAENERLSSAPKDDGVKVEPIRKRFIALLADPNWYIRARTLEALHWSQQSPEVMGAAAKCIKDPNFVVRLMAIRFFVSQQGDKFNKVLESIAKDDSEQSVRLLAKSYLPPTK